MKIQATIITITIVIMVIVSVAAFGTFSFAVRTNSTGTQHTTSTASPPPPPSFTPSKITAKNPVAHNATTLTSGSHPCSGTDNYLWNHVYGKTRINGTKTFYRFHDYGQCITVTGTVYSSAGTTQEPDGDLHFTLQLDPQYEHYSNQFDPQCIPHGGSGTPCKNIIVEVICHNAIDSSYNKFGDYCKGVNSVYPYNQKPSQGDKLSVSGRWVQDIDQTVDPKDRHLAWNEIHPASNIHKIP
jgi:hypothetical protein